LAGLPTIISRGNRWLGFFQFQSETTTLAETILPAAADFSTTFTRKLRVRPANRVGLWAAR
jgi:hypothetical protein